MGPMVCDGVVDPAHRCPVLARVCITKVPHRKMGFATPLVGVNSQARSFCWSRACQAPTSSLHGHVVMLSEIADSHK
jgi:hypothetical protein